MHKGLTAADGPRMHDRSTRAARKHTTCCKLAKSPRACRLLTCNEQVVRYDVSQFESGQSADPRMFGQGEIRVPPGWIVAPY